MEFNCLKCSVYVISNTKRKFCSKKCQLDHWYEFNSTKKIEKERLKRIANPEKFARKRLKIRLKAVYGWTIEKYEEVSRTQNNVCAICKKVCPSGRLLSVDHCHKTGKIRGLLCMRCNKGLGSFNDNIENMLIAIDYLKANK